MIEHPPIWITFTSGKIAETGASVLAITFLSTNDSRIKLDVTC
jgi:hypothetical protein